MKLCLISDSHNRHKQLNMPPADILIHAGDMTIMGTPQELQLVAQWFKQLIKDKVYKYIVFTPGNHDWLFEKQIDLARLMFEDGPIYCLINQEVVIDGMKFYGAPQTIFFFDWAFNIEQDKLYTYWDKIPLDTDVLITHQPPYGIGDRVSGTDRYLGCRDLRKKVEQIQPRLHVWGHIHTGDGQYRLGKTQMVNASMLDEQYKVVNEPIIVEI